MKIAILNDTHAGIRNDSPHFADYQEKFYTELFFPYLRDNNIKTVLHLGDMFDRRKYINHVTLKRYWSMFVQPIIDQDITVYLTVGNHDVYWKNTNSVSSPKTLLSGVSNFKIIDIHPEIVQIGGTAIGLVPWITEDNHDECISFINTSHEKTSYLFGHFEIANFEMMKGAISTDGLDRSVFKKYDLVGSGHYHTKSEDGPIVYFGTQMEFTWSDYNDPKFFHVFDTEKETVESIQNPDRMFYRLVYDDTGKTDEAADGEMTNKIVRVVVKNKTDVVKFEQYMSRLRKMNPLDLVVMDEASYKAATSTMDELDIEDDDAGTVQTTMDILNLFVDGMENLNDDLKDPLKSLFHELYVESIHTD